MSKRTISAQPPDLMEVIVYFVIMGLSANHAECFYLFYEKRKWRLADNLPVKNWKVLAFNWVLSFAKARPLKKVSIRCR